MSDRQLLTTSSCMPVGDSQNTLFAGPRRPVSTQEWLMIERLAHH